MNKLSMAYIIALGLEKDIRIKDYKFSRDTISVETKDGDKYTIRIEKDETDITL